jgi:hypothetical protein
LSETIKFIQIPKKEKKVVFYSENKNTWIHLKGLILEFLKITNTNVYYISSDKNDPGLSLVNPNFKSFNVGQGYILNWLFANIETDVFVMTTPDLNSFQLKRSKNNVHYLYVQHSLVSLHMGYREGAFDHFDTIFCAGPHHVSEMQEIVRAKGLAGKNIVEHGYSRLDQVIKDVSNKTYKDKPSKLEKHILVAPSWGENCIIETIGCKLIKKLLDSEFQVTLRPHPQTLKLNKTIVDKIVSQNMKNPLFSLEDDISSKESFYESDLMISDWSGAALDYALSFNKPVIFIDLPKKINNPEYSKIRIEPFEVSIRSKLGAIVSPNNLDEIPITIDSLIKNCNEIDHKYFREELVFNLSKSDNVGAQRISELVDCIDK